MSKRVGLYARVSTSDQKTGLESQIRALKEYCERHKITDYELYTDENFSGAKASRPSLDRMMEAVRHGDFSTIVVYSFSRFARSTTHLLSALEEMKEHTTEFVSITEQIETNSPMGRAFFTLTGSEMPNNSHHNIATQTSNKMAAHADDKLSKNSARSFTTMAEVPSQNPLYLPYS